ncbi:hypothetical protein OPT61_g7575 [Boeremia exigua]|uniref:Uncharacterized protein n=1 Tax=Boeremia exigua TaxID=749465 RepID=A0ACC2I1T1_9PLEO|nr:hypothetical protein OPT61_g7575 [Boeremia exigua]
MRNTRISLAFTLPPILALISAMPHAYQQAVDADANANDDFWARKPIHTTDLMAGKPSMTVEPPATYTQTPTVARIRTSNGEMNEL